tara:strand:+ start:574 stop:789 length:216 start_codon:yes stop_codon:yes gene_type:complete
LACQLVRRSFFSGHYLLFLSEKRDLVSPQQLAELGNDYETGNFNLKKHLENAAMPLGLAAELASEIDFLGE